MKKVQLLYTKENRLISLNKKKDHTPKYVATVVLKRALQVDGLELTLAGTRELLEGWAEHYTDISDTGQIFEAKNIADTVADFYIYCNGLHILENKVEVGNHFRAETYRLLVRLLEYSLDNK